MEIWRSIPNYDNKYQVSNLGNVKSLHFGKEKLLSKKVSTNGYLILILYKDKKPKTRTVHQLVAETFLNHKPDGTQKIVVDHINNNKLDNRLINLQLITQRLNKTKDKKETSSKYTGVVWNKHIKKWMSSIRFNGKKLHLGYFINEYDAHISYQNKLNEINKSL